MSWLFRSSAPAQPWADLLAQERARYDALLEKYHALKLAGAAEPVVGAPVPKAEPDPVLAAIRLAARGDAGLSHAMLQQVTRDRRAGLPDEFIINQIEAGVPVYLDGVPE